MDEEKPLVRGSEAGKRRRRRSRKLIMFGIVMLTIVILCAVIIPTTVHVASSSKSTLPREIECKNIKKHLQKLQEIANANNNSEIASRSVLDAYNASADYVTETLRAKGFEVTHQPFEVPLNFEMAGSYLNTSFQGIPFNFQIGVQFNVLRYSAPGTVSSSLWVNSEPQGGCDPESFAGFVSGEIALLTYEGSNCSFYDLARNAYLHNASAVVIAYGAAYKGLAPSRSRVTGPNMEASELIPIPALSVSYEIGQQLRLMSAGQPLEMQLFANTEIKVATTYNVFATMPRGNPGTTIIVGSHLDSVPAGPGINDNGSGSSVNLELAILFADLNIEPKNKVVFAWWAAEEWGLVGSRYYVRNLSPEAKANISLNLNMDMLGSPNYYRGVYNGSAAPAGIETQSETLMQILEEYFCEDEEAYELLPFTGRSDYGPFIDAIPPIPAGAVATGADGSKTIVERKAFGGFANVPYDTCYHQGCDTIDNIDFDVLEDMAESVAGALQVLLEEENMSEFLMQNTESYRKATCCLREKGSNPVIRTG